jgi:hypothetical protein
MKARRSWRTIDFRPNDTGWRAVYLDEDGQGWTFKRVVGWLIQEEVLDDAQAREDLPPNEHPPLPDRRVVAGIVNYDAIEAASDPVAFSYLLAPGDVSPAGEAALEERRRREGLQQRRVRTGQEERGTAE